uniref:Immediate-early protein n=1 Tax=Cercopithecine alphaherpesvirus 9 TaxID=35246 RepID=Q08547_9ALPH|nr:immediate-early protein [Cercopithecine alphaherpesvirus 9]
MSDTQTPNEASQRIGSPSALELMELIDAAAAAAERSTCGSAINNAVDVFGNDKVLASEQFERGDMTVLQSRGSSNTGDIEEGECVSEEEFLCEDAQDLMDPPVYSLVDLAPEHLRREIRSTQPDTSSELERHRIEVTALTPPTSPTARPSEFRCGRPSDPRAPRSPAFATSSPSQKPTDPRTPRSPAFASNSPRSHKDPSVSPKETNVINTDRRDGTGDPSERGRTSAAKTSEDAIKPPKKGNLKKVSKVYGGDKSEGGSKVIVQKGSKNGQTSRNPGPVEQLFRVLSREDTGVVGDCGARGGEPGPRKQPGKKNTGIGERRAVPARGKPRAFGLQPEKPPQIFKSKEIISSSSSSSSSSSEDEDTRDKQATGTGKEEARHGSSGSTSDWSDVDPTQKKPRPGFRSIHDPDPRIRRTRRSVGGQRRRRHRSFSLPRSITPVIPPLEGPLNMPDGSPWPGSGDIPADKVRFGPSGECRDGLWDDELVRAVKARYEMGSEPAPFYIPELGDPSKQYHALINLIYCPDRDPIAWLQNPKLTGDNLALSHFCQKLLPPGRAGTAVTGSVACPVPHVGEAMARGEALWALPHAAAAVAMSRRYDRAQKHFILQSLRRAYATMAYPHLAQQVAGQSARAAVAAPEPQCSENRSMFARKRKSQPAEGERSGLAGQQIVEVVAAGGDGPAVKAAKRRASAPVTASGDSGDSLAVITTMPKDGPSTNGCFRRVPAGALHTPVPSEAARRAYCAPNVIESLVDEPMFPPAWRPVLRFDPAAVAEISARGHGGVDRRFGPPSGVDALRRRCAWMHQVADPEDVRLVIIYDPLPGESLCGPTCMEGGASRDVHWSDCRGGLSVVLAALSNRLCLPDTHAWAGNWSGPPDVSQLNARGILLLSTRDLAFAGAVEYLGSRLASAGRRLLILDAVAPERWPRDGPAISQYHVYVKAPARPDAQAVVRWPRATEAGLARAVFASSRTFGPGSFARVETAFSNLYPNEQPIRLCRGANVCYVVATRAGPRTRVPLSPRDYRQYVLPGFDGCKDIARQAQGLAVGAADFVDDAAYSHRAANRWGLGAPLRPVYLPEGRRPGSAGPRPSDVPLWARVFCRHALPEPDPEAEPIILPPVAGRSVAVFSCMSEARESLPPIPRILWPPGFGSGETAVEMGDGTRLVFGHHGPREDDGEGEPRVAETRDPCVWETPTPHRNRARVAETQTPTASGTTRPSQVAETAAPVAPVKGRGCPARRTGCASCPSRPGCLGRAHGRAPVKMEWMSSSSSDEEGPA